MISVLSLMESTFKQVTFSWLSVSLIDDTLRQTRCFGTSTRVLILLLVCLSTGKVSLYSTLNAKRFWNVLVLQNGTVGIMIELLGLRPLLRWMFITASTRWCHWRTDNILKNTSWWSSAYDNRDGKTCRPMPRNLLLG